MSIEVEWKIIKKWTPLWVVKKSDLELKYGKEIER